MSSEITPPQSKSKKSTASKKMPKKVKIKVELTILQGKGLVAKDRNMLGRNTSSDPYVEVWADNEMVGKSSTVCKTLNPVWEKENTFTLRLEGDAPKVALKIFDEDFMSDPDAMGTVIITIPTKSGDTTDWYEVPKKSAKNATGQIQVRLQTTRLKPKKDAPKKKNAGASKGKKKQDSPKTETENTLDIVDTSAFKKKKVVMPLPPLVVHSTELITPDCDVTKHRIAELEEEVDDLEAALFNKTPYAKPVDTRNSIFSTVEFLQQEVKVLTTEKREMLNTIQETTNAILGRKMSVKLTIIQGEGLVAKDTNMLGRKTSSDPYVEVWVKFKEVGKTATQNKTLDPMWNERFDMELKRDNPKVVLKIWDEDFMAEPDSMGIITLEIPTEIGADTTQWYDVPEGSAKNASGRLQVRLEIALFDCPKTRIEQLEKNVEGMHVELSNATVAAPKEGQNGLAPTMEFLQQNYKSLLKEKMTLQQSGY
jgi:Ca2+-dependent lipid-binding protein